MLTKETKNAENIMRHLIKQGAISLLTIYKQTSQNYDSLGVDISQKPSLIHIDNTFNKS
jgi:hypothetical protein